MSRDLRLQPHIDALMALAGQLLVEEGKDGLNLFRVSGAVAHLLLQDNEIRRQRSKAPGKRRSVKAHLASGAPLTLGADVIAEAERENNER